MRVSGLAEIDGRLLVIFDGRCGFCNRAVRWFLRRDRGDRLRFVASESEKVAEWLKRRGIGTEGSSAGPGAILVVEGMDGPAEKVLAGSDAVAAMLSELPQAWPAVGVGLRLIPRPVRELGYRVIARWRYRIWGRLESCPLPSAEERERFL
jgi:predicted DCC family thiol-disulfide oxidoreductase YuxK